MEVEKVALVVPPYRFNQFYPDYQTKLPVLDSISLVPGATAPLGIMYISAVLKNMNIDVKFIDGVFETEKSMIKELSGYGPDLVGIYVSSPLWRRTKKISERIKREIDENILVCVGGPHVDRVKEEVLEGCEHVDFGICGDGEKVLPELIEELQKEPEEIDTEGVIWRQKNEINSNSPCPKLVEDLDSLPLPDRDLVDLEDYCPSIGFYRKRPSVNMVTSRGCRMACSFCHAREKPLRERSIEDVIEELRDLEERGVKDILLYDQDFGANRERSIELCKRIVEEDFDFYIGCNLRIDSFDKELLEWMRKAGFWRVFYGIESSVQDNLDQVAKGINKEKTEEVVRKTDEMGFHVFGSFIFGIPGQTYEDGVKTIEFAKELPLTYAKFTPMSPWPGSDMWENPEKYGKLDRTPNKMSMNMVNFVPESMTEEELRKLLRKGFGEFYIRPKYFWRRLKQIETVEDIKQNIRGFLSFIRS